MKLAAGLMVLAVILFAVWRVAMILTAALAFIRLMEHGWRDHPRISENARIDSGNRKFNTIKTAP